MRIPLMQKTHRINVSGQMVRIATGYVTGYFTDITIHDVNYLRAYRPKRFLWSIRPHGTNLVSLDKSFWDSEFPDKQKAKDWIKIFHIKGNSRFFLYEFGKFTEITRDQAMLEIGRM